MREPLLIIAIGTKGVGKTHKTCNVIQDYIKDNPVTGKVGRKTLIYDVNMEYTENTLRRNGVNYKADILAIEDLPKWTQNGKVEVRRIIPKDSKGKILGIDGMVELLDKILYHYRGGLLILEDINRYLIDTKTTEIIGTMATNRHRDLDIYIHLQSLSPVTTRMWQNCQVVRFHKQTDSIDRYKQRIPNAELYFIAEKLVNNKYLSNQRFYCYVNNDYNKISGKFSLRDFQKAAYSYIMEHRRVLKSYQMRFGYSEKNREKMLQFAIKDLMKYYGN